jgi:hypothetical protein
VLDRIDYCKFHYFFSLDESSLPSIFRQQITNLILVNNDTNESISSLKDYTKNVYVNILNFFKNLKHLNIIGPYVPGLSLCNLSSTTFYSSILTYLCITVANFDDCLYLVDGRLKRLTTFNVTVYSIDNSSTIVHNMVNFHRSMPLDKEKYRISIRVIDIEFALTKNLDLIKRLKFNCRNNHHKMSCQISDALKTRCRSFIID